MEFRRLLLALSLSFVFIIVWQYFFMPTPIADGSANTAQSNTTSSEVLNANTQVDEGMLPNQNIPFQPNNINWGSAFNVQTQLLSLDLHNGAPPFKIYKL